MDRSFVIIVGFVSASGGFVAGIAFMLLADAIARAL